MTQSNVPRPPKVQVREKMEPKENPSQLKHQGREKQNGKKELRTTQVGCFLQYSQPLPSRVLVVGKRAEGKKKKIEGWQNLETAFSPTVILG